MKKYLVLLSVSTLMSAEIVQAQENNVIEAPTPTVETAPAVTPKVEATPLVLTPTPTTETAPTETPTPTEPTPVAPTTGTKEEIMPMRRCALCGGALPKNSSGKRRLHERDSVYQGIQLQRS